MKTKKKTLLRLLIALVVVIGVVYASLPYYARQALIHWMPVIDDLETFHRHTVHHNPDDVWHWPLSCPKIVKNPSTNFVSSPSIETY